MSLYKLIGLLLLLIVGQPSLASIMPLDNAISKQLSVAIKNTQYLVENSSQLELDQVLALDETYWQGAESFPANLGVLEKGAWLKFELNNVEPEQVERILEVANPRLHHLDIYIVTPNNPISTYRLGSSRPFLDRSIMTRNFAIPLVLEEKQSVKVYLRVESSLGVYVPLYLHQENKFWQLAISENISAGLYFGILLMFIVFNISLYLFRNDALHLLLAVDLSVFMLLYANHLGLNFEFFWPMDPQFNHLASLFFSYLVLITANVFTWTLVNREAERISSPRGFYYGFNALAIMGFVLLWFVPIEYSSYSCATLVLFNAYYLLYLTYLSFRNQHSYAEFYFCTYGLAALATTVYIAHKLAFLPSNEFVLNAMGYSMLLQALVLSSVLSERKKASKRVLGFHQGSNQSSNFIPHSVLEWVAQFSHEIRTPLSSIVGIADLLKETPLNPTQYNYVNNVASSGEYLVELVSDVLDYESLSNNQMKLVEANFNLEDLCRQSIALLEGVAKENKVEVKLEIEFGMPLSFYADSRRLRQILINLLSNSLKFTKNGKVVISLSYSSDRALNLQVWDDGIGMTKQQQKEAFKDSGQTDNSMYQQAGRNGLGLFICEQLAILMSGSISVESELNKYCCINVTLPIAPAKLEGRGQVQEKELLEPKDVVGADSDGGLASSSSQLKILGVDDNEINRRVLKAMLNKLGHTVIEACNGQEAIDIVRTGLNIDLILMDCEMPVMNGFEATREIRQWQYGQADKHCKIIALSAHILEEHQEKCLEAGMDGYLSKPLHLGDLRELIEQLA